MSEPPVLKASTNTEVRCEALLIMMRAITRREPTLQDKKDCRRQVGLPPLTK